MSESKSLFDPKSLDAFPQTPGVYLMKDVHQKIIYIGKAINLKNRVKQYFAQTPDPRPFVSLLPEILSQIDLISTQSDKEALILERTLILKHKPKYNVLLKYNDRQFFLKIDLNEAWPKFEIIHKITKSEEVHGIKVFGPYLSFRDLNAVYQQIEKYFQIRNCADTIFRNRATPCLQYQIKRCSAPCVLKVNRNDYLEEIQHAIDFLDGKTNQLLNQLEQKMLNASAEQSYELAIYYRDQIIAIQRALEPQLVSGYQEDCDSIGFYRDGDHVQIVVLEIRNSKLSHSDNFDLSDQGGDDEEVLESFLCQYYAKKIIPSRIDLPFKVENKSTIKESILQIKSQEGLSSPVKTFKLIDQPKDQYLQLRAIAIQNAQHRYLQTQQHLKFRNQALLSLKQLLKLRQIPLRIECYDISLIQGDSPVGSQVVFHEGKPLKSAYRIRHITEITDQNDDFGMMREVLMRRFSHREDNDILPDLLIVDGGKGQLNVAVSVLSDLGIQGIDLVGLAKARHQGDIKTQERVFIVNQKEPVVLKEGSPAFRVMTQARDEAHRFALNAHRKLRTKNRFQSELDGIQGLGKVKKTALLKVFENIEAIKSAQITALSQVEGIDLGLATRIYEHFHQEIIF
jgi:excinuclease ABC subunit C